MCAHFSFSSVLELRKDVTTILSSKTKVDFKPIAFALVFEVPGVIKVFASAVSCDISAFVGAAWSVGADTAIVDLV